MEGAVPGPPEAQSLGEQGKKGGGRAVVVSAPADRPTQGVGRGAVGAAGTSTGRDLRGRGGRWPEAEMRSTIQFSQQEGLV